MPRQPFTRITLFPLITLRAKLALTLITLPVFCANAQNTGLWVGKVQINKVTDATDAALPETPSGGVLEYRILLHVDASGAVKLLKDVTVMKKTDGSIVLVTDPAAVPNYAGVLRRDGKKVGLRYGTAAYDFGSGAGNNTPANEQALTGTLENAKDLTGTITIGEEHPTNPFKHKYHPDHAKGVKVEREIKLTPQTATNDPASQGPAFGVTRLVGTYEETLKGLRKASTPIKMTGTFSIDRVSDVDRLN